MKIAIGMRPFEGPWGGGNRFVQSLSEGLAAAGHAVVHTLDDGDIDVILLMDPRTRSPNVTFGAGAIQRYLLWRNPNAVVVHRINECDERKGERFINDRLVRANACADWTVFVGEWLTKLPVWRQNLRTPWRAIHNGADEAVFNSHGFVPWSGSGPIRLVTHHWGYHRMKGFDVYEAIDNALDRSDVAARIAMTYIGNLPKGFTFRNVRYLAPLDGKPLAAALRAHHVYLTGSINEPGGNHQNEGALCGLPLLYRNSGCMPEYCTGFGLPFEGPHDVLDACARLSQAYPAHVARMSGYPHTARNMVNRWAQFLVDVEQDRSAAIARRHVMSRPAAFLRNMLPI